MFFGGMRWGLAQMKYVYFPLGRWKTGKKKKKHNKAGAAAASSQQEAAAGE